MSELLAARGLSKTFRQGGETVRAVRGVDLEIAKGERVYIHGPSGAGKSTLLNMLGALMSPSEGKVIFSGKRLYALSDSQRSSIRNRNFGFVFQFYHLLPELSVLENVMLPARITGAGTRQVKARAVSLLERVSMGHRLGYRPNRLSGGEAQRVAIARALVNAPDVLFCDEPTGNLDSEMSKKVYELLLRTAGENRMSVVVVSHQEPAEGFFHSSFFMKDGVLYVGREERSEGLSGRQISRAREREDIRI